MIDDLLAQADRLVKTSPRKPRQADLRRSISAAYYAVFHALARNCADTLVGTSPANRPNRAWAQTYRALNHGEAKTACKTILNMAFPETIKDCALAFVELQEQWHAADYDPLVKFWREDALAAVALPQDAVLKLRATQLTDRRAFAVQLLFRKR